MAVLAQWLLLFSSPFCMVVSGRADYWWTHPLENYGLRPFFIHPWMGHQVARRPKTKDPEEPNADFNRFGQQRFRLTKRFDEAQIQDALTPNGERSKDVLESLRQLLTDNFKLRTRLRKRSEIGAGKEYITRLGKRSWIRGSIHRLSNGWQPLKTPQKRSSWGVWTSPAVRHQMLFQSMKGRDAEQIMKKADKI